MIAQAKIFLTHAQGHQPVAAESAPICKPLKIGAGLAEEFKLHLLKLTYTENKVSGGYLISEGLAYLTDTERYFASCCALDIYKVHENTLRGLGTKIHGVLSILRNALEGFEHKVELSYVGKVVLAARGARDIVVLNK